MKTILLSTAALLLATTAASAQETDTRFNLSAGYTFLDFDDVEFDALNLRAGYDFTPYFGVEGETLIGLGDDSFDLLGVNVDTSLNYALGAFAKAQYPLTDAVSVHGRLGYVTGEIEADVAGVSLSEDSDGPAYGFGAEYAFNGKNAVRADYTRYDFEDDAEADGWSVSYVRRF